MAHERTWTDLDIEIKLHITGRMPGRSLTHDESVEAMKLAGRAVVDHLGLSDWEAEHEGRFTEGDAVRRPGQEALRGSDSGAGAGS